MGEKSHVRLPALSRVPNQSAPPSLDEARRALGGRIRSGARAGWGAVVLDPRRGASEGVVLCDGGSELDVWIGEGLIARVAESAIGESLVPEPPARFVEVAADIVRFWSLVEDREVGVMGPGPAFRGVLREQCRFGALVERPSEEGRAQRVVVAVGFRRLSP